MKNIILNNQNQIDSVVIFLHIPKTGGLTFNSIINRQYKNCPYITPMLDNNSLPEYLQKIEIEKIKLIRGHLHFGVHKVLPHKNYTYITFLRNPIERVISAYYYLRNNYNYFQQITLYEFVTNKKHNLHLEKEVFNKQTHMLSGKDPLSLEIAKNNLKNYFSVVGITERYNESLSVVEKKLGWKTSNYTKRNITPNKPPAKEIPDEIIDILERKNQNDIKLYEYANKLLTDQLQQLHV